MTDREQYAEDFAEACRKMMEERPDYYRDFFKVANRQAGEADEPIEPIDLTAKALAHLIVRE